MCAPEVPVCSQNSSAVRWSDEPLPEEAKTHLVRVGLEVGQHVGHRLVRRAGRHHQHIGRGHQHGEVVKVLRILSKVIVPADYQMNLSGRTADEMLHFMNSELFSAIGNSARHKAQ
jgi:hypothetical protein